MSRAGPNLLHPARGAGEATSTLLLRGVQLADSRLADVRLRGDRIDAVGAPGGLAEDGVEALDLPGYLLLPALVEPHAHLDKAYSADAARNETGDLAGAVTAWLSYRPRLTEAEIISRAHAAVQAYVDNGATAVRTHVDVGADIGLRALEAVAAVRSAMADRCVVQLVAFISSPLCGRAGANHRALLREAMAGPADIVGACPGRDDDPVGCIDICLSIAADCGAGVDLHVDEDLEPEPSTLLPLCDAVIRSGFPHGVVASHCVSLGAMPRRRAELIAERTASAGVAVVCLPQTNLYLQGRAHECAPPRGLTALRALRGAGVAVAAGGDNLQDPFNCLGRADPLEAAALLVLAGHDAPETAYAAVAGVARRALGLSPVDIKPGAPAELLAIRARSVREAIAQASPDRVVVHAGRIVARTSTIRHPYPSTTVLTHPPANALSTTALGRRSVC